MNRMEAPPLGVSDGCRNSVLLRSAPGGRCFGATLFSASSAITPAAGLVPAATDMMVRNREHPVFRRTHVRFFDSVARDRRISPTAENPVSWRAVNPLGVHRTPCVRQGVEYARALQVGQRSIARSRGLTENAPINSEARSAASRCVREETA